MSVISRYRKYLYAGAATAALIAGSSVGFAASGVDVSQTSTNSAPVNNPATGTNTINIGGDIGTGGSASISAGGAAAATSVTGINTDFTIPTGGFGTVTQSVTNNTAGAVSNNGTINYSGTGTDAVGTAGSLSIGASGAVASISISGIGAVDFTNTPAITEIAQGGANGGTVVNSATVTNIGVIDDAGATVTLSGAGSSASVTAIGAQALASIFGVDATGFAGAAFGSTGNITQAATNNGVIENSLGVHGINLGDVSGAGASVSATAAGAVASLGITYIASTWSPSTVGDITQTATNNDTANVSNDANTHTIAVGAISGDAASVRASATGALTSVSVLTIDSTGTTGQTFGTVMQTSINGTATGATVTNTGVITATSITGPGGSAGISATGAGASFSIASINDTTYPATTSITGPVTQSATNSAGSTIGNTGTINLTGGITGAGSSATISATGAGAYVSFAAIK